MAAEGAPAEVKLDAMELRENARPHLRIRSEEHWLVREDEQLREFQPAPVRGIIRAAIEADLAKQAAGGARTPRSRDRHTQSSFILKDVLRSKQGGHKLSGKVCGRGGDHRYYRCVRGQNAPKTGNILARAVPATPLEKASLGVLREVLLSRPDLELAIRAVVERHVAKMQAAPKDRAQIEHELKRKQKQIAAALEHLTGDAEADGPIEQKLVAFRAETARLKMALATTPKPVPAIDVDGLVRELADELQRFGEQLDGQDNESVRQMFGLLASRMEVDLLTKEAEIELRLPDWIGEAASSLPMMSLEQAIPWNTTNETHRADGAKLATYRCQQTTKRPVCFECRRVRKAA